MEAKAIEQIRTELVDVLAQLPLPLQEEVLDFALFLRYKEQAYQKKLVQQGAIGNQAVDILKAEFAEEDAALAEAVMPDLSLQQGTTGNR